VYSYDIRFGHISYKFKQFQADNLHARGRLGDLVDSRLGHYDGNQTNIVLKLAPINHLLSGLQCLKLWLYSKAKKTLSIFLKWSLPRSLLLEYRMVNIYIYIYCFMFSIIISTLFMFPLTLAEAVFLHLCIRKDYLKISSF